MNGKEILSQELQQGVSNISIQHLAAGLYFYRITSQGKFVESGKWVKE
jgi:hemin uptake protein HemP